MRPRSRTVGRFCSITLGFGWPRFLAWSASFTAFTLAIVPGALAGGQYEPMLAVLTATLIAAVWAGFFAFRSVHPPAAVRASLAAETGEYLLVLRPEVRNPTGRAIQTLIFVNVWLKHYRKPRANNDIETELLDLDGFYRGERLKLLGPHDGFAGFLNLSPQLRYGDDISGYGREELTREALVEMWVEWTDDLCERGRTEPKHWQISPGSQASAVVDPQRVAELFDSLPRTGVL